LKRWAILKNPSGMKLENPRSSPEHPLEHVHELDFAYSAPQKQGKHNNHNVTGSISIFVNGRSFAPVLPPQRPRSTLTPHPALSP
jgi:hypothetical protein